MIKRLIELFSGLGNIRNANNQLNTFIASIGLCNPFFFRCQPAIVELEEGQSEDAANENE